MRWGQPEVWNLLFSGWNGAFYWHPILAVGAVGLLAGLVIPRRLWSAHAGMVAAVAVAVYVNACAGDWWAGSSFGMRRFASLLPFFAVGLAAVYARLPRRVLGLLPMWSALVVATNVVLAVGFERQVMRPFFATEVALLGWDFWREFPGYLTTLPMQYDSVGALLSAGRGGAAAALAACGAVVVVLALGGWRTRAWWLRGRRVWIAAGLLLVGIAGANGWMLAHAVQDDAAGIAFSHISPLMNSGKRPSVEDLEAAGREWAANPVPWLWALDAATTDTERLPALDALRGFSAKLWAKAVMGMPDTPLRRELWDEAAPLAARPGETASKTRMEKIDVARVMSQPRRERRAVRACLRAHPLSPFFEGYLAVLWRRAGKDDLAEELESLTLRARAVRVESFARHAQQLGEQAGLFFQQFVRVDAYEMDLWLWRSGDLKGAKNLYETLTRAGTQSGVTVLEPRVAARQRMVDAALGAGGLETLVAEVAREDVDAETVSDASAACMALGRADVAERVAQEGEKRWPDDSGIGHALGRARAARDVMENRK
ncbi:hypothetical protein CVU37_04390 [candidate division BRC1 bacterium HGW-BRC1-1]|nr:MAG: hypothetical protein CVU37_04390 [candidate division BRC1 bacterium HGW-BRC1-1]